MNTMPLQPLHYFFSSSTNLIWLRNRHYLRKHELLMAAHNWGMWRHKGSRHPVISTVNNVVASRDIEQRIQMEVGHGSGALMLRRR